uniref:Myb-like protein D n=1 Tax=Dermatophagoides pteronyssinus TaxID=6956 RepID=A0A6P6Y5D0_DERPT|nr:myb-like protein D [Dermatophagoides pteronyssinus]
MDQEKYCSDYDEPNTTIGSNKMDVRRCHSTSRLPSSTISSSAATITKVNDDRQIIDDNNDDGDGRQSIDSSSTLFTYSSQPSTTTNIIIAEPVTNDFDDGNVDDRNEGEQSPNEQIWISDSKKPADNEDDDDRYCFNDNFEDILVDCKCHDEDDEDNNSKKHLENETKQLSLTTTRVIRHQIPKRKIRSKKMRTLMELGSNRMFHERYSNLNKNSLQSSSKNHHKQRRRHEWKQSCCSKCCSRRRRRRRRSSTKQHYGHRKQHDNNDPYLDNSSETIHSTSESSFDSSFNLSNDNDNESNADVDDCHHTKKKKKKNSLNNESSSKTKTTTTRTIQIYVEQESCLPQGTLIDIEIATGDKVFNIIQAIIEYSLKIFHPKHQHRRSKIQMNDYHFHWENYSLLAIYSTNIKHLNNDFYFNQLQSPWNDLDAKLYLHFNYHQHHHNHHD